MDVKLFSISIKKSKALFWLSYLIFACVYLSIHFMSISSKAKITALDGMYLIMPLLAIIGSILAAVKVNKTEKRFWLYMALANVLFFMGELFWIYYEVVLNIEPPQPSFADYSFLSGYIFFFLALISMARFSKTTVLTKVRYFLDLTIVMVTAFTVILLFILRPIYSMYPATQIIQKAVNLSYPVLDLGIIFGILINLTVLKTARRQSSELLIALGLLFYALGDLVYNYFSIADIYNPENLLSNVLDLSWLFGYFLFFIAAIYRITKKDEQSTKQEIKKFATGTSRLSIKDMGIPALILIAIPFLMYMAHFNSKNVFDYWTLVITATILSMITAFRASVVIAENKQLFSHSMTDYATGLFNLRFFHEQLPAELDRAKRYSEKLSLAVIDIDDFRQINDLYGHDKGDKVLSKVGNIIKKQCRSSDTVCRIGEDNYIVIMPHADSFAAFKMGTRIQKEVTQLTVLKEISISVSIGIAMFPDHALDKDELLKKAEGSLYWIKFHRKNQILVYDEDIVKALNAEERIKRLEEKAYLDQVQALAATVDTRDPYTKFHSAHVSSLAILLAKKLGLSDEKVELIEIAALLHDIGKIGIPDRILKKKSSLTEKERKEIQEHPGLSQKILGSTIFKDILPWVLSHHERWDGKGYPQGLKGNEIPIEARILAICDAFDAMNSDRPYRKALPVETALQIIKEESGKQFDPNLTGNFIDLIFLKNNSLKAARA